MILVNYAFLQSACPYLSSEVGELGVPLVLVDIFRRSHFYMLELGQMFCAAFNKKR